jgi:hypothetical protein
MPGPKTQHHPSVRYVGFSLLLLACVCSLPLVLCVRCASRPDSSRAQVRKKFRAPQTSFRENGVLVKILKLYINLNIIILFLYKVVEENLSISV